MNYKALAFGAALGFLFAVAPSCGGTKKCDVSTCSGCCTADATCSTANSATACGTGGKACSACAANETCNAGTCVAGGAGGGGASNACGTKCVKPDGTCGADCANGCCIQGDPLGRCSTSPSISFCGKGGEICQNCTTATGSGSTCTATTGGSQCVAPNTSGGKVGDACASNADCTGSPGLSCKTSTGVKVDGGAAPNLPDGGPTPNFPYPGGFCTKTCGTSGATCPSGSSCVSVFSQFRISGESEKLCLPNCTPPTNLPIAQPPANPDPNPCRDGYSCIQTSASASSCFVDPDIEQGVVGSPCNSFFDCGSSWTSACQPATEADGGGSGWPQGYCTADCSQSYSTTGYCGAGAFCVVFNDTQANCAEQCANPDGGNMTNGTIIETPGRANCRQGYVCVGGFGTPTLGACSGACDNPGASCIPGFQCQDAGVAKGYCCEVDGGVTDLNTCINYLP